MISLALLVRQSKQRKNSGKLILNILEPVCHSKESQTISIIFIRSPNSGNFISKKKGEIEAFLRDSGFESVSVLQPSLLLGNRTEFRLGEK
jgi:uncharacterized protein YbjT (DUF2867 family)